MWWGSASPQAKCSFYPRFAIIHSSRGCTDVWRALMECQRKGQTMQILFVQPNLKSHTGNYPFAKTGPASSCHFFPLFQTPALNVTNKDLQRNLSWNIRAGWGHMMFHSTGWDVCRWTQWFHLLAQWAVLLLDHWLPRVLTGRSECTLRRLVFLLLYWE